MCMHMYVYICVGGDGCGDSNEGGGPGGKYQGGYGRNGGAGIYTYEDAFTNVSTQM